MMVLINAFGNFGKNSIPKVPDFKSIGVYMLYLNKIYECLRTESNPINRMYLNELILNWKKVEATFDQDSESPITKLVNTVSDYTHYITQPRFLWVEKKTYGFPADHDIFQSYYLYDIIEKLLYSTGLELNSESMTIMNKPFTSAVKLQNDTFRNQLSRPVLDSNNTASYLTVALEFDVQYRLLGKRNFVKLDLSIPLMVFYIEKFFNQHSFIEIEKLRKDIYTFNSNAILFCITESVDKNYLTQYEEIKDILYVARANFKHDGYNHLQPQVFLKIFGRIANFINGELMTYDKYVPFGHVELYNKI